METFYNEALLTSFLSSCNVYAAHYIRPYSYWVKNKSMNRKFAKRSTKKRPEAKPQGEGEERLPYPYHNGIRPFQSLLALPLFWLYVCGLGASIRAAKCGVPRLSWCCVVCVHDRMPRAFIWYLAWVAPFLELLGRTFDRTMFVEIFLSGSIYCTTHHHID